jgi:hypothetical protein
MKYSVGIALDVMISLPRFMTESQVKYCYLNNLSGGNIDITDGIYETHR